MRAKIAVLMAISIIYSTIGLPYFGNQAHAKGPLPTRPQPIEPIHTKTEKTTPLVTHSSVGSLNLSWSTCGYCPEASETSFSGNTIKFGVTNRGELDYQNMAIHGASALLPPASKYTITFDYALYTWDSYQPSDVHKGYWDSFSVSVSGQRYWQLGLSDPITSKSLPSLFITGGSVWGEGILQNIIGSQSIVVSGNPAGSNYLNVILDTATLLNADHGFPSWGTITIRDVKIDQDLQTLASHAAELAKTVVGGPYVDGLQGYDWSAHTFVNSQAIKTGYNTCLFVGGHCQPQTNVAGLDCEGLVLWAYNKDVSSNRYGGPIKTEGANNIFLTNTENVSKADLRPGDLLFFGTDQWKSHVAMYVGGSDPAKNVVEAANPTDGIKFSSLDDRSDKTKDPTFWGFRRVIYPQLPFVAQSHSPVTLIVTDPDGYTVSSDTTLFTDDQILHEVPGILAYRYDDQNGDSVIAPSLKTGLYTIQVVPKPNALPTDHFSLDVTGNGQFTELAENALIRDIPSTPFELTSTGDQIIPKQSTLLSFASVNVNVAGVPEANYSVQVGNSTRTSFDGLNDGPVQIDDTDGTPIIGAERVIYKVNGINTSFSEMMGLPNTQLDSIYWLPWYNNVDLDTQLRFGNVSGNTAHVHVYIGEQEMPDSPFSLDVGQSTRVSFAGVNNGPVKIQSDQNIVAAERVIYNVNKVNTSFSEMMALPNSQLNTTYWLPWYNNVDLDTQLRFGNVSSNTAHVHVLIGGQEMPGSPFTLEVGQSTRVSFAGVNNGPVKIESDQNIVAAERVIYKVNNVQTSFTEMMALPKAQLNTTYWLPWYNNVDLDTQLRFGNVSSSTAHVHVLIGGVEMAGSPFTLQPGESTRQSFTGVNNGPVKIESDQNIIAAERVIYKVNNINTSFSEMMGLPNGQLDSVYWLPWYNNVDLDTQLRFGVP